MVHEKKVICHQSSHQIMTDFNSSFNGLSNKKTGNKVITKKLVTLHFKCVATLHIPYKC